MTCPICQKPTNSTFTPFCSHRCSQVDLHRWFTGGYKIETEEYVSPEEYEHALHQHLNDNDPDTV